MENLIPKDPQLKNLLEEADMKMPFTDFEDRLMQQISKQQVEQKSIRKDLHRSWLFFILGLVVGLGSNILVPKLGMNVLGVNTEFLRYPILIITTGLVIWQLDNMVRLTFRFWAQVRGDA